MKARKFRSKSSRDARFDREIRNQSPLSLAFSRRLWLAPESRSGEYENVLAHQQMQSTIEKILDKLDERERKIIVHRYGLGGREKPQTLQQVGSELGVTKERIRQIEARALSKLKRYAAEQELDFVLLD